MIISSEDKTGKWKDRGVSVWGGGGESEGGIVNLFLEDKAGVGVCVWGGG